MGGEVTDWYVLMLFGVNLWKGVAHSAPAGAFSFLRIDSPFRASLWAL